MPNKQSKGWASMFRVLGEFLSHPVVFTRALRRVRKLQLDEHLHCYRRECPEKPIGTCDLCGVWICMEHKISRPDMNKWLCPECNSINS